MKDPHFDIAFSIGRFHIYWYAILLASGIAAAMFMTDRRTRGRDMPKDIALDLCILGVPFGVLGARVFACLSGVVGWGYFFDLTRSGLSFFGGLIFATLAILVYLKLRKVPLGEMLDAAAPGVFASIGIAVWGDFFNRANYGPLVEKASHKWFPLATFGSDLKVHYAAFFYEFLLCAILIALYYVLLRRVIRSKADRFLLMALVYCLGRFGIDSIRQNPVMMGPMAFDQICEIVLSVLCLVLLFIKRRPQADGDGVTDQVDAPVADEVPSYPSEPIEDHAPATGETGEDASVPEPEETFTGLS